MSDIVTISLIIAIAGTFPLQLFVVSDILEELLFKSGQCNVMRRYPLISQCAFRAVLVVLAAGYECKCGMQHRGICRRLYNTGNGG